MFGRPPVKSRFFDEVFAKRDCGLALECPVSVLRSQAVLRGPHRGRAVGLCSLHEVLVLVSGQLLSAGGEDVVGR